MITFPRRRRAGFASCVSQLNPRDRPLLFDESSTSGQGINMGVTPNAQVCRRYSAIGRDGCGFCYYQSGTAHRSTSEMNQMPIGGHAILA
jgi:hypothetical protein